MKWLTRRLAQRMCDWLVEDMPMSSSSPRYDFDRLHSALHPGDVVLVAGRARVSEAIKLITQSPWTHSALYVGRLDDIRNQVLRDRLRMFYDGEPNEPLLVEALLGQGTVVSTLEKYRNDHLRICRPSGLSPADTERVLSYCIERLGSHYDTRQLLDLARFFFPWTVLPRRWRSSLFQQGASCETRTVCSCLLAEAFDSVGFPILPFIHQDPDGSLHFFRRNPRLFTPKDFDYSPYFKIIKHPFLGVKDQAMYRRLPWSRHEVLYNDLERDFRDQIAAIQARQAGALATTAANPSLRGNDAVSASALSGVGRWVWKPRLRGNDPLSASSVDRGVGDPRPNGDDAVSASAPSDVGRWVWIPRLGREEAATTESACGDDTAGPLRRLIMLVLLRKKEAGV